MSGLVAIVSRAREVRVSDGEIDEMARAYESLRG
jgi:hypothetical protein